MIMTKFGQYFGQIWPCLGQNLSKLIFHQTYGLMGVDLKFQIFLNFFFENLVNLAKIWKNLLSEAFFVVLYWSHIIFRAQSTSKDPWGEIPSYVVNCRLSGMSGHKHFPLGNFRRTVNNEVITGNAKIEVLWFFSLNGWIVEWKDTAVHLYA